MKRILPQPTLFIILTLLLLLNTACSAEVTAIQDTATPTPQVIITSTLPPTQTPIPSQTPEPPTPTVAVAPAEGQTISQLNVRSAPSAESNMLGSIPLGTRVQIVGKDVTSGWWLIVYSESPTGTGWVTAQYVQSSNTQDIPVVNTGTGSPGTASASITEAGPTAEPGSATVASPAPAMVLATAFPDGDSTQSPAVSITL